MRFTLLGKVSVFVVIFMATCASVATSATSLSPAERVQGGTTEEKVTFDQYVRRCAVPTKTIDLFLSGPTWARFDSELGYIQQTYVRHDAIDSSSSINTFSADGTRTSFLYANRKPRINTYGDSFTSGEQVNDGETWQEYLAAHLGEPIRNYGIGGYGLYQSYRRMIREETTGQGAEYLILYIWGDDATRSLLRARYCAFYPWFETGSPIERARRFHGNFWPHVEMNLQTGQFVEKENPLPTPQALYRMTDPRWMAGNLKDDLALQLAAFSRGSTSGLDRKRIAQLAARLDFDLDQSGWNDPASSARLREQAAALLNRYAQRANQFVLDKARSFARDHGKKLMIVLFDPYGTMKQLAEGRPRDDQETLDYLRREKIDFFDMNEEHVRDFRKYNLSWDDYLQQYFIGHYNPRGNHFFAYALKDKMVDWLDPKPITYSNASSDSVDFTGYLNGYRSATR